LDNVHPIPTTQVSPQAAASDYERELMMFYGAERLDPARPLFDVTFLGLGTDGHTASLFPGSPILDERDRWVAPVIGLKPETRITLTYPTLESSQHVAFLATGKEKQEVLDQLRQGSTQLPAGRLSPVGERVFFADATAAGEIIA
jgi:6-phosphogluconolactonase